MFRIAMILFATVLGLGSALAQTDDLTTLEAYPDAVANFNVASCGDAASTAVIYDYASKQIHTVAMDKRLDVIPPCGGVLPPPFMGVGALPLATPLPQLAKLYADNGNSNQGQQCSATLIGDNIVITAAHCVLTPGTNKFFPGFK